MKESYRQNEELRPGTVSLVALECPGCQGEGFVLSTGRPGDYAYDEATFFPSEAFIDCPECGGEGRLEGCGRCLEPLTILQGREVCGCSGAELAQAA